MHVSDVIYISFAIMLMPLEQIGSLLKTLKLNVKMGISLALAHLQDNMKPYEGLVQ